ncbi:MAG: hypothetical protein HKP47_07565, partial [Eudoraea sp.]|nr:hypothetical protein [Eudoraea sp.]
MKISIKFLSLALLIFSAASCGNADDDVAFDINTNGDLGIGKPVDDC